MGLILRKTARLGKTGRVNVSRSGVSVSKKFGRFVTVNSRGRITIRLAPGISFRI
jgi:hypothetical protein